MDVMTEGTWERHSNPLSVWSRILTNPLVYLPIWNRSWRQALPIAAWFVLNPRLFPPPKDDSAWATKSVLGEQIWTKDLPIKDLSTALNALSAVSFALAAGAAFRRRPRTLVAFGGLALALKMAFLARMAVLYERRRR